MLNNILLVVIIVLGAASLFLVYSLLNKLQEMRNQQTNDKGLVMLNQNLQGMGEKLDKTTEAINERLTNAARVIAGVQKELGTVQERFKGFEEFSELLHPKLRGNIGEQILADMLAQAFPQEMYGLQQRFKDGQVVDAVIKTKAGVIPIDSKFPLDNFKQLTRATNDQERTTANREFVKAVKKHIDDISKKYVLPEEGTVNFAVMYVPSENVYYQILTDETNDLLGHAKTKNVLVTSPHGFFNFLRVILMGLERTRLQEQSQKIWEILKSVQSESVKFYDQMQVVAKHVTNAKNAVDAAQSEYGKLTSRLDQVKLLE